MEDNAIIDYAAIRKLVSDKINGPYWDVTDSGIGPAMIEDVTTLIIEELTRKDSDLLDRIVEQYMDDVNTDDIAALHKRQGKYKREDWWEEGDATCMECEKHYLHEKGVPEKCQCGGELKIFEGI